jgi:hypothetical protein
MTVSARPAVPNILVSADSFLTSEYFADLQVIMALL